MNALTLDLVRERYRQNLQILNYSPRTLHSHVPYFNRLGEFMAEAKVDDLAGFTGQTLSDFQRWLFYLPTQTGQARGVAGQNRILSFMRGLFAFLHQEGLITHNPAAGLKLAREPDPLPKNVLTPQEARKIVEAPDTATSTATTTARCSKSLTRPASEKRRCSRRPSTT